MRKTIITFLILALYITAMAQETENACVGLKNPTNFTTSGSHQETWTGYTGSKNGVASTCTYEGSTFTTAIQAAQLESYNNTNGCSISLESTATRTTSEDINGNLDYSRQFVIKGPGFDPETYSHLSYLPPDTTITSSIRLGNYCGFHGAEKLSYDINITPDNALLTIWYAMSLQNGMHSGDDSPEFTITLQKNVNGSWVSMAGDTLCLLQTTPSTNNIDTSFLYGITASNVTSSTSYYSKNIYLPWRKVMINLYNYLYETIRINIATGDCSMAAHYALAYIAGDCQPMTLRANGCVVGETDAVARIYAPKGASTYSWYRSKTGTLTGSIVNDESNYEEITDQTADSLNCFTDHFIHRTNGDTLAHNTFMCKITTNMNEASPLVSTIFINVGISKPTIIIDSTLNCDGSVTLTDLSYTPYAPTNNDQVDTSATQWKFYSSGTPTSESLMATYIGGTASHSYPSGGNDYCVKIRTTTAGGTCWNEKTIPIRAIKYSVPQVQVAPDSIFVGDNISITDLSYDAVIHQWTLDPPDTTFDSPFATIFWQIDTTTVVTLHTTNSDGCSADTVFIIYAETPPAADAHACAPYSLRIYPNPTNGKITIEADNIAKIEIIDGTGRTLAAAENTNTIDLQSLAQGTYILRITTSQGVVTRRITKTK